MNYDFGGAAQKAKHSDYPDPYEVLNLSRDSDLTTIKNKFRALTKAHHPDRNRRNPNYDPSYYAAVCLAYETLSDPRKRLAFDQSSAANFHLLRTAALDHARQPPSSAPTRGGGTFQVAGKFSDGDNKRFNEAFEQQRKADPNDRGYGDMMVQRITEQEAKTGQRSVEAPVNIFGTSKVNPATFNGRFQSDLQAKRRQRSQAIQERGEGEPEGWFGGTGLGLSDISMFDGVIVNQEQNDFSRLDGGNGLQYADYMAGFETITEHLPEDHAYYNASGDVSKQYNERLSQLSNVPERGHKMSFQQAEAALQSQREKEMHLEQERNRQVVLKYREQYSSQDLLPHQKQSKREASQAMNQSISDRTFFNAAPPQRRP